MTDTATVISTIRKNSREEIRIALKSYMGFDLVDVRIFADKNGVVPRVHTTKGISIRIEALPELIAALEEAGHEAQRRGLLPPPSPQRRSSQVRCNDSKRSSSSAGTKEETSASQQNEFLFPSSEE